jgi:hypothetical protein
LGREGDGREDIQEEEEGREGQKGGQNPLSVDNNVSWDNFEGNSQHAQGAERQKDLDEGGDLSSQGEGAMPPSQAADELREAMADLKKFDHLREWDGGQDIRKRCCMLTWGFFRTYMFGENLMLT